MSRALQKPGDPQQPTSRPACPMPRHGCSTAGSLHGRRWPVAPRSCPAGPTARLGEPATPTRTRYRSPKRSGSRPPAQVPSRVFVYPLIPRRAVVPHMINGPGHSRQHDPGPARRQPGIPATPITVRLLVSVRLHRLSPCLLAGPFPRLEIRPSPARSATPPLARSPGSSNG